MTAILQPGEHLPADVPYLPAAAGNVVWGRLPCAADVPVLKLDPGTEAIIDTISHEGILEDQGRDPRAFFAAHGVDAEQVLHDAVDLAAGVRARDPGADGPHVVTGPIHVDGVFVEWNSPLGPIATRSVNVPPTSMPTFQLEMLRFRLSSRPEIPTRHGQTERFSSITLRGGFYQTSQNEIRN